MSIGLIFLMSLACVAGALILLIRLIGLRRVLQHATWVDIGFTVVICFALAGTLTGLLIGIVAGLVMTGSLAVVRAGVRKADSLRAEQARVVNPVHDWCPGGTPGSL